MKSSKTVLREAITRSLMNRIHKRLAAIFGRMMRSSKENAVGENSEKRCG